MTKQIITSAMLDDARKRGEHTIPLAAGALITPQARDDARRFGISLVPMDANTQTPMAAMPTQATNVQAPAPHFQAQPISLPTAAHTLPTASPASYAAHALMPGASVPVQPVPSFVGTSCASAETCSQILTKKTPSSTNLSCASAESCSKIMPFIVPTTNPDEALFAEVRRRVIAALPANTSTAEVETLVRNALGDTYHVCEGCKNTGPCPVISKATETSNAVTTVGNVDHVSATALSFGAAHAGAIGLMDVLEPKGDATAHVGYLQGDNASMAWTPERSEVLVVLEGRLTLSVNGSDITANIGDVIRIGKGQAITVTTQGLTRCALISA